MNDMPSSWRDTNEIKEASAFDTLTKKQGDKPNGNT